MRVLKQASTGSNNQQVHFKTVMVRKSGKLNIEWWFTKVPSDSGFNEIQGFGIDISEKEQAIREASYLKNHDVLTGLFNADSFTASLDKWMTGARYAILYTDCNHFGLINNRYGFDVGDKMLIEASQRIRECIKRPALFCRPGADEFIVAVELMQISEANELAECLLDCLSKPYVIGADEIRISSKVGVAIYPDDSDQISNVIRQAESVLPRARRSQNSVAFYDLVFHTALQRQLDVEQRLRIALEENLLQVYLQPKVDLRSGTYLGYEALLRWNDPVLGFVSPVEFIKVAEAMSLATQVDRYVILTVLQSIRRCLDEGQTVLPIAVNITSSHFGDPALVECIFSLSNSLRIPLAFLDLEVTEGALLEMSAQVKHNLRELRASGVKIAIDDFGTGYSSLSYIRKLSVDAIKIDKSFVDDIQDKIGQQLISAVIAIATAVNLDVVAEGIETELQRQLLLKLGCTKGQGYVFAKPQFINDVLFPSERR